MFVVIVLGSMRDLKRNTYDEIWFIIRSVNWMKDKSIFNNVNVIHVPILSPSQELFFWYNKIKNKGSWTQSVFDTEYVPRFINEIFRNDYTQFKRELNLLWFKSKHGKKILILCPCNDESMCHRSIIGGILLGAGVDVRSTTVPDISSYLKYYDKYRAKEKTVASIKIPKDRPTSLTIDF